MTKKVNFSTRSQLIRGSLRYLVLSCLRNNFLISHFIDYSRSTTFEFELPKASPFAMGEF